MSREVPGAIEKWVIVVVWMLAAWIPSLVLYELYGYFGFYYSPGLWLLTAGVTAPLLSRALGRVGAVAALPAPARMLPHLPAALARLVEESASIRAELGACPVEDALARAWVLGCELERLPPGLAVGLDASRAALVDVRDMLDLSTTTERPQLEPWQQAARLKIALERFEGSLAEPQRVGFR